jgi:hypothetical protein
MLPSEPLNLSEITVCLTVRRDERKVNLLYSLTEDDLKLSLGSAGSGLQRVLYEMLTRGIRMIEEGEIT